MFTSWKSKLAAALLVAALTVCNTGCGNVVEAFIALPYLMAISKGLPPMAGM